jgi:Icc-related predicted phosphoesterase
MKREFIPWMDRQPAERILWTGGNHDFACEQPGFPHWIQRQEIPWQGERTVDAHKPRAERIQYLQDAVVDIDGIKVFGSPWTPNLRSWAFYKDDPSWSDYARKLPDADIYMLHSPPQGILCGGHNEWGSPFMASALYKKRPKAVVFGHIHEGYGIEAVGIPSIVFRNVAYMDEFYHPGQEPHVFEV